MKVIVYEHSWRRGREKAMTSSASLLYNWDDRISSIEIIEKYNTVKKEEGVTIFEDRSFKGARVVLSPGKYNFDAFGEIGNNRISSLSVPKGYKIIAYQERNFKGYKKIWTASQKYLYNWEDKISSVEVVGPR